MVESSSPSNARSPIIQTIRLPVHLVDKISKMRRVAMLQEELGREPTDEELAVNLA